MSWQIGLAIVIRHCGIHFLVHHYRDCKPAAQTHIVACRRCPVLLSRVTTVQVLDLFRTFYGPMLLLA